VCKGLVWPSCHRGIIVSDKNICFWKKKIKSNSKWDAGAALKLGHPKKLIRVTR
jgi:hypothetical protein